MHNVTFKDIYKQGKVVENNELYRHIHFPEFLLLYDGNYIEFKKMPSAQEFAAIASYLRKFHKHNGQHHVKFYLPENEKPTEELIEFFKEEEFDYSFIELYAIDPKDFPSMSNKAEIQIETVKDINFDDYLAIQYEQEIMYGEDFATQKVKFHRERLESPNFVQYIALFDGKPAGSVDVIIGEHTVEIDGLLVKEDFRHQGIASRLQERVMKDFANKTVILVADGEDTPREMYQKQNYKLISYQYEILKLYL